MNSAMRILITGTSGMVGSAVMRHFRAQGFTNLLTPKREELELTDKAAVDNYFRVHRPEVVLMLAAKVGGIGANLADPVGFLKDNVETEINVFDACYHHEVKRVLFLGSSCIYPAHCQQPMKESYLLNGPFEPTNEGYALAKVVGIRLAQAYFRQYGLKTLCPIPPNLYGTGDHFNLNKSHVLSALVKRFVDARDERREDVTLWGTGVAKREFMHVQDLAEALMFLLCHFDSPEIINVGTGTDISIRDLANMIASEAGYTGTISWDDTKPDGMLRKCMDVTKFMSLGYRPRITLQSGIKQTIVEYETIKAEQRI